MPIVLQIQISITKLCLSPPKKSKNRDALRSLSQSSVEEAHHLPVSILGDNALGELAILDHEAVRLSLIDLHLEVLIRIV